VSQAGGPPQRISAEALRRQADIADRSGRTQLGENLQRAAELTALSDKDLIAVYEALRPRRSSRDRLLALADDLAARGAPTCAELVREAVSAYAARGLLAR
jgi:propanediol dehydratase small subunit